eukprot:Rhum_TRINITY_DN14427_c15_g1::Rhum_TRINITY_DN14427_c15_g1_i1::g.89979::m.89979
MYPAVAAPEYFIVRSPDTESTPLIEYAMPTVTVPSDPVSSLDSASNPRKFLYRCATHPSFRPRCISASTRIRRSCGTRSGSMLYIFASPAALSGVRFIAYRWNCDERARSLDISVPRNMRSPASLSSQRPCSASSTSYDSATVPGMHRCSSAFAPRTASPLYSRSPWRVSTFTLPTSMPMVVARPHLQHHRNSSGQSTAASRTCAVMPKLTASAAERNTAMKAPPTIFAVTPPCSEMHDTSTSFCMRTARFAPSGDASHRPSMPAMPVHAITTGRTDLSRFNSRGWKEAGSDESDSATSHSAENQCASGRYGIRFRTHNAIARSPALFSSGSLSMASSILCTSSSPMLRETSSTARRMLRSPSRSSLISCTKMLIIPTCSPSVATAYTTARNEPPTAEHGGSLQPHNSCRTSAWSVPHGRSKSPNRIDDSTCASTSHTTETTTAHARTRRLHCIRYSAFTMTVSMGHSRNPPRSAALRSAAIVHTIANAATTAMCVSVGVRREARKAKRHTETSVAQMSAVSDSQEYPWVLRATHTVVRPVTATTSQKSRMRRRRFVIGQPMWRAKRSRSHAAIGRRCRRRRRRRWPFLAESF